MLALMMSMLLALFSFMEQTAIPCGEGGPCVPTPQCSQVVTCDCWSPSGEDRWGTRWEWISCEKEGTMQPRKR